MFPGPLQKFEKNYNMMNETASQCNVSYTHPKNSILSHEKVYNHIRQQQEIY
jgi:hypothetical protein